MTHLHSLFDDVPRRHTRVVDDGRSHARRRRGQRLVAPLVPAVQLFRRLVGGEVERVRRASAECDGRDALVEAADAFSVPGRHDRPPQRLVELHPGVAQRLHPRLYRVHRVHDHMLAHPREGPGDHVLRASERASERELGWAFSSWAKGGRESGDRRSQGHALGFNSRVRLAFCSNVACEDRRRTQNHVHLYTSTHRLILPLNSRRDARGAVPREDRPSRCYLPGFGTL